MTPAGEQHPTDDQPTDEQRLLGAWLTEARARHPLGAGRPRSQQQLVDEINKSIGEEYQRVSVSNWENAKHLPPKEVVDWYEAHESFGFQKGYLVQLLHRARLARARKGAKSRNAPDGLTDVPDGTSPEERDTFKGHDLETYWRELNESRASRDEEPVAPVLLGAQGALEAVDPDKPSNPPGADDSKDTDEQPALVAVADRASEAGPVTEGDPPRHADDDATERRERRQGRRIVAFVIGALVAAVVVVIVLRGGAETSQAGCPEGATPPATTKTDARSSLPKGVRARARVLFVVDVSYSMRRKDLNCFDPGEGKRVDAATAFVASGLELDEDLDRVGVWLVTNSRYGPPAKKCRWESTGRDEPTHCVLQPLTKATDAARAKLAERVSVVRGNDGGTPLYRAIAEAVREVRRDRRLGHGDAKAVSSVVAITDGVNTKGSPVQLAAAASDDVQVLITAFDEHLCNDQLAKTIDKHYRSKCYTVRSSDEAAQVGLKIPNDLLQLAP